MKAEDYSFQKMMEDLKLDIVDIDPDGNWFVKVYLLLTTLVGIN